VNSLQRIDRATAVLVACLVPVGATLVQEVAQQREMADVGLRLRLLYVAQAGTPMMGLLLVIAAAAALRSDRNQLVVQAFGVVLASLALVGAVSLTRLPDSPAAAGWRVGVVLYSVANGVLAAFAVWLAGSALAVPDASGEPPD
jgi:hypothetical protein